ncbi:MAG: neutral zinc metallopeptidase [Eubacteriales bacterium]|nr:neutral zinc metallopeptidase [Eubacteriales bacterium]
MDLRGRRRSTNVDDRRGQSVGPETGFAGNGFGFGFGILNLLLSIFRGRGGGSKLLLLVLLLLFVVRPLLFSSNEQQLPQENDRPRVTIDQREQAKHRQEERKEYRDRLEEKRGKNPGRYANASDDEIEDMLLVVLASTEDVWHDLFEERGLRYEEPTLVFFSDYVQSACGLNSKATGPFYCPADNQVYIDLSFFKELSQRFGASGDGAVAYVLAHEVGHHVQNQLGIMSQVDKYRRSMSEREINKLTVRLELQADYFAGVWAHYAAREGLFEPSDAEDAIEAALAIGDDHIQMQTQGRVIPENFTHGTSEQRQRWFARGYKYGDIEHGNTFELDYDQLFFKYLPELPAIER